MSRQTQVREIPADLRENPTPQRLATRVLLTRRVNVTEAALQVPRSTHRRYKGWISMGHSSDFDPAEAARLALGHQAQEGVLLPLLHDLQARFGWIAPEAVAWVAAHLNLSRAEVHGVVSFYHDFRDRPPGRRIIKLCQAEACQARGSRAVTAKLEDRLGVSLGETAADRSVTLEPVYCLGLCGNGPAALVDGRPFADLGGRGLERCLKVVGR